MSSLQTDWLHSYVMLCVLVLLWNYVIEQVKQKFVSPWNITAQPASRKLFQNLPCLHFPAAGGERCEALHGENGAVAPWTESYGLAARSGAPPEVPILWQSVIDPKIRWSPENELEHEMIFFWSEIKQKLHWTWHFQKCFWSRLIDLVFIKDGEKMYQILPNHQSIWQDGSWDCARGAPIESFACCEEGLQRNTYVGHSNCTILFVPVRIGISYGNP